MCYFYSQWIEEEFLGYLDAWEVSVQCLPDVKSSNPDGSTHYILVQQWVCTASNYSISAGKLIVELAIALQEAKAGLAEERNRTKQNKTKRSVHNYR